MAETVRNHWVPASGRRRARQNARPTARGAALSVRAVRARPRRRAGASHSRRHKRVGCHGAWDEAARTGRISDVGACSALVRSACSARTPEMRGSTRRHVDERTQLVWARGHAVVGRGKPGMATARSACETGAPETRQGSPGRGGRHQFWTWHCTARAVRLGRCTGSGAPRSSCRAEAAPRRFLHGHSCAQTHTRVPYARDEYALCHQPQQPQYCPMDHWRERKRTLVRSSAQEYVRARARQRLCRMNSLSAGDSGTRPEQGARVSTVAPGLRDGSDEGAQHSLRAGYCSPSVPTANASAWRPERVLISCSWRSEASCEAPTSMYGNRRLHMWPAHLERASGCFWASADTTKPLHGRIQRSRAVFKASVSLLNLT